MEQIVVKSENDTNEEILLYYVDENGENEQGVVTTLENLEQNNYMQDEDEQHIYMTVGDGDELITVQSEDTPQSIQEFWTDEETRRLLVFYTDNKQTFLTGATQTRFLWSVACKTMIPTKNPNLCQDKLQTLKQLYLENLLSIKNGDYITWEYFELAHQAFLDDETVHQELEKNTETFYIEEISQSQGETIESSNLQIEEHIQLEHDHDVMVLDDTTALNDTPILNNLRIIDDRPNTTEKTMVQEAQDSDTLTKVNKKDKASKHTPNNLEQNHNNQFFLEPIQPQKQKTPNDKIENMLRIYLKHKNALKNVHKDYWVKGLWENIVLELGEKDAVYWHKRFLNYRMTYVRLLERKNDKPESINWPYMALFDEIFKDDADFQRKYNKPNKPITKPQEVDTMKWNYTENMLLVKYYFDSIDEFLDTTIPNNFLWNEVGRLLNKKPESCENNYNNQKNEHMTVILNEQYNFNCRLPLAILFDNIIARETKYVIAKSKLQSVHWTADKVSALVKFISGYMDMFKDPIGYFVCFAAAAKKLLRNVPSCLSKWQELRNSYTNNLNEKNSNLNIQNWSYMNEFDMIYDFGANKILLAGYETDTEFIQAETPSKDKIETKKNNLVSQVSDKTGDWKAHEILEYYLKNKAKFLSSMNKKLDIWEVLARKIGMRASQCAHRFRNLKQVYLSHLQREITKPEMPIVWPYYPLCKKVFGYRSLKSKLKSQKHNQQEEWTETEIGTLIKYFTDNLMDEINADMSDTTLWAGLTHIIDRTPHSCREKFIELRKSYRKLKTMKRRNAAVNVTWKYFNLFDDIFTGNEPMEIEQNGSRDSEEEEDYQCIIILPENNDVSKAKIVTKSPLDQPKSPIPYKWTKQKKNKLLLEYLKFIKSHKNEEINPLKMWNTIADNVNRPVLECRKMFARLKKNMRNSEILNKKYPYAKLINKIQDQNPKFKKRLQKIEGFDIRSEYTDLDVPNDKVKSALEYYLSHMEEFTNPRFEKKYVWMELAKAVDIPVKNIFNKVNYLKSTFDTNENINEFSELLKLIIHKENESKNNSEMDTDQNIEFNDTEWSDSDIESLMIWYLANLERFKSPKYTRKYLWQDISKILHKSPLECSNKMIEIRTEYKKRLIDSDELTKWKYTDLCQKIYGPGKSGEQN